MVHRLHDFKNHFADYTYANYYTRANSIQLSLRNQKFNMK